MIDMEPRLLPYLTWNLPGELLETKERSFEQAVEVLNGRYRVMVISGGNHQMMFLGARTTGVSPGIVVIAPFTPEDHAVVAHCPVL